MLKRYNDFIKESLLSFDKEIDEDLVTIEATLGGSYIGKVDIEYVISGYYEFENEMSEERYDELFPNDSFAKISSIEINDKYKGSRGYGKILMEAALKDIKSNNEKTVYLNASPMGYSGLDLKGLVKFYEKFGFKVIVDDYSENKEMLLTLETTLYGQEPVERTIDAVLMVYGKEAKEREKERREKAKEDREKVRPDVIIDEFDEETPSSKSNLKTQQPSMSKITSLGDGSTNMP